MTTITRWLQVALVAALSAALVLPAGAAGAQATAPAVDYEVVSEVTNEPMSLDIAEDGRIFWGQRDGTIFVMTPNGVQSVVAELNTAGNLCPTCGTPDAEYNTENVPFNRLGAGGLEEGGLQGILLDNDFEENGHIYVYRSIPGSREDVPAGHVHGAPAHGEGTFHLSRFTLDHLTNVIDPTSEQVLLEVPAEWDYCCHYSGDLDYLPDGTITLTTGDDVSAESSQGYGPRNDLYFAGSAEFTSANPGDLRGKVLRLREDGTVPDGSIEGEMPNPFIGMEGYVPDTLVTDEAWVEFNPYVYSMGWKQPWRAVVHPSGTMYVSDVGPDSTANDPQRGPVGYEEINTVPLGGGSHNGWPRCVGPNYPYVDVRWEGIGSLFGPEEAVEVGETLDCGDTAHRVRPIGSTDPAEEVARPMHGAEFYYPSGASEEWPIVGNGGKTSEPVAFYPAATEGALRLPEEFNDRLIVLEWSRNYILTAPSDPETGEVSWDNDRMFIANINTSSANPNPTNPQGVASAQQGRLMAPIDGKVNPVDGAFYFLEYGAFFYAGANGRLSRVKCAGCQPELVSMDYGVTPATSLPAATAGLGDTLPTRTIVIGGLALALAAVTVRRRRQLA